MLLPGSTTHHWSCCREISNNIPALSQTANNTVFTQEHRLSAALNKQWNPHTTLFCINAVVPHPTRHSLSPLRSPLAVIIAHINSMMLWRVLLFSLVVLQCLCKGVQPFPVIVRAGWRVGGGFRVSGRSLTAWISGTHKYRLTKHKRTDWLADKLLEADQCEQQEWSLSH